MYDITRTVYCFIWGAVCGRWLRSDEIKWSLVASLSVCGNVMLAESERELQRAVNDSFK